MCDSTQFKDLLAGKSHPVINRIGLRTWAAGEVFEVAPKPDEVHLFLVMSGILAIEFHQQMQRVLPREALRIDGLQVSTLRNLSRTDELEVIQIEINKASKHPPSNFERYYHPDESKENKLCLIASEHSSDGVLSIGNQADIHLSCLGKWETLLYEYQPNDCALVVVLRGSATIGGELHQAVSLASPSSESPMTIIGKHACEILAIRSPLN